MAWLELVGVTEHKSVTIARDTFEIVKDDVYFRSSDRASSRRGKIFDKGMN